MKKDLEEALWKEYDEIGVVIGSLDIGSDEYRRGIEEQDKIRNELIKCKQIEESSKVENDKLISEELREKKRFRFNVATFVITTGISLAALYEAFHFDRKGSYISSLGEKVLSWNISSLFKK